MKSIKKTKDPLIIDIKKLKKNGWLEIKRFDGSIKNLTNQLGKMLGIEFSEETTILKPKTTSKTEIHTLSGNFGLNQFPYHTDGAHYVIPPRYIIMRNISKHPVETSTILLNPKKFIDDLSYETLFEHEVYFVTGGKAEFYTTLINKTIIPEHTILRYNAMIMSKLNEKSSKSFYNILLSTIPKKVIWSKNKTIIIDNWNVLHGREDVKKEDVKTRQIERTYLFDKKYNGSQSRI